MQLYLHLVAVDVIQLTDAMSAGVDRDVILVALNVVPQAILMLVPVAAVEALPLGSHIDEVESGVLKGFFMSIQMTSSIL